MDNQLRLYKDELPQVGDIVVVSLKQLEENNAHVCSLLEYKNVTGVIVKVSKKKKDNRFEKLEIGSQFLIFVLNINHKKKQDDVTTIDLHYMEIDDDKIRSHIGRYQQFLSIVNAFTYIVKSVDNQDEIQELTKQDIRKQRKLLKNAAKKRTQIDENDDLLVKKEAETRAVSFNYLDQDENVRAKVNIIMEETLYKYPKEDIEHMFFKDTIELHQVASQWIESNKIPNFMDKLVIKFPRQTVHINMVLSFTTAKCNGIQCIKDFYTQLNTVILQHDDRTVLDFSIHSMPLCNVNIKSDLITPANCAIYLEIIKQFLGSFNDKHTTVKIISCHSDTSTSLKTDLMIKND